MVEQDLDEHVMGGSSQQAETARDRQAQLVFDSSIKEIEVLD